MPRLIRKIKKSSPLLSEPRHLDIVLHFYSPSIIFWAVVYFSSDANSIGKGGNQVKREYNIKNFSNFDQNALSILVSGYLGFLSDE